MAVEIEREAAPAAADVEHLHAGLEIQLGGDVRLLVELGLFQAVRRIAIIRHRILPVLVEEQLVEAAGEVVGVLGIAPRAGLPVDLVEPAQRLVERLADRPLGLQRAALLDRRVVADEQDEIADVPGRIDRQPAVHIGFARADARILGDVERGAPVGQPGGDRAVVRIGRAVAIFLAVMIDDDEFALLDQRAKHLVQKPHRRVPIP